MKITSGMVVSMHYELTDENNDMLDATEEGELFSYLHGHDNVIPGLEKSLEGLAAGDKPHIIVHPAQGYGVRDPNAEIEVPRSQFPDDTDLAPGDRVAMEGLANLLDVEPITAARMLDRLQQAGLVERRPDPADRRAWRLHLTPRAGPLLGAARVKIDTMIDAALGGFSTQERTTLALLLTRLRDNLSVESLPSAPQSAAVQFAEVGNG